MARNTAASYPLAWLAVIVVLLMAFWLRIESIHSLPAGLSRDEALNVVMAHQTSVSGVLPLFENFEEPEPLYRLLLSLAARLTGGTVTADRIISAFIGTLTIAAAYRATLQCLHGLPPSARHAGALVAAVALTLALGHITLSRALYRGILQPLWMLLALGFLLRGLRTNHWRDSVLAGVMCAAAVYSYTSAYVTPLAVGAMGLSLLLFRPRQARRWLPHLMIVALTAFIVLLPFVLRLATTPQALLSRSAAVAQINFSVDSAVRGMADQLLVTGDENPQYNVANAPVIPAAVQLFFVVGLVALVLRVRHPTSLYLMAMMVLVSVPVLLGNETTHGLRVVGWFGVFPVVCGIGAGTGFALVNQWVSLRRIAPLIVSGLLVLTVWNGLQARDTYRDYWLNADNYRRWRVENTELNHSEWFFRTDMQALVAWIAAQDRPVLLPLAYADQSIVRAWLLQPFPQVAVWPSDRPLPNDSLLVLPYTPDGDTVLDSPQQYVLLKDGIEYVLPQLEKPLGDTAPLETVPGSGNFGALAAVYALPDNAVFAPVHAADSIRYGHDLVLQGWSGSRVLESGRQPFSLVWSALRQPLGHDYMTYVQVLDVNYERVSGLDTAILPFVMPTSLWTVGSSVPQNMALEMPVLEAGAYRLVVGAFAPFADPLAAYNPDNQNLADPITVGWLKVRQPVVRVPDDSHAVTATFNAEFDLLAYTTDARDDGLHVRLYWQSRVDWSITDATIFVHLIDETDTIQAQQDTRPQNGRYPTFVWEQSEIVATEHVLAFNDPLPDSLRLRIGMYTLPDVQNLSAEQDGQPLSDPYIVVPLQPR